VQRSRVVALRAARHLIPDTRRAVWAQAQVMSLLSHMPTRRARAVTSLDECVVEAPSRPGVDEVASTA